MIVISILDYTPLVLWHSVSILWHAYFTTSIHLRTVPIFSGVWDYSQHTPSFTAAQVLILNSHVVCFLLTAIYSLDSGDWHPIRIVRINKTHA